MNPERWQRIKDVALAAMEQEGEARSRFLDQECGADSELRRAVEDLLAEDARSGGTIEHGIAAVAAEVQKRPAVTTDEAMIGQTISHYKITEKLGEGGMGVVYKAEDTKLKRAVALKFLPVNELGGEKEKARFLREAQAAASLNHPNICTIHEIDEVDGRTFIAMEFVDGQTVKDKIASRPQPLEEALDIAIQTAQGLKAAHQKEIVHRDIKPANLMLTAEGQVKIMDFGLALPGDGTKLTQTGSTVGTIAYMPPEQCQGQKIDHRADIWSLGVVGYEMITGQVPFKGDYQQVVAHNILNEDPEPITALRAGVPMELEWIVGKCLAKKTDERYQQIEELIVDLRGLKRKLEAGKSTILPTSPAVVSLTPSDVVVPKRKLRLQKALFAVTTVALLVLAVSHFRETHPEAPLRKFSFTAPVFNDPKRQIAISPNGQHIAYTTPIPEGKLWIWDLDREQRRAIEGIGIARQAFWSPGSDFVGFADSRDLKIVPAEGGLPVRVCQMPGYVFGGTWSPDGDSIVFTSVDSDELMELYEVPARGGTPNLLIPAQPSAEGEMFSPRFLPSEAGNRVVLFTYGSAEASSMVVLDLESGRREDLGPGANPVYSPSGHIIYQPSSEDEELWALPFSAETLKATGTPFPIYENGTDPTVALEGTLVYLDVRSPRQLIWLNRRGEKIGGIGNPLDRLSYPTLSPNGRSLAFTAVQRSRHDVLFVETTRGVENKVNLGSGRHASPVWSPSGEEMAFTAIRDGNCDIFLRRADGTGEEETLVSTSACEWVTDWSRDGKHILYESMKALGRDLWYLERTQDGGWEPRPYLQEPIWERAGKFSPNGRHVVYLSNESGQESGRPEVYVRPFPQGGRRVAVSNNRGKQPRWSRDGKELFFVEGNTLMAASVTTAPTLSVSPANRLFENPALGHGLWQAQYDVSEDGQRFVLAQPLGSGEPTVRVVQNWFAEFQDRQ